jgi:hypothetical protein
MRIEGSKGSRRKRLALVATAVSVAALAAPTVAAAAKSYSLPAPIDPVVAPVTDSGSSIGTVSWSDVSWDG